MKIAFITGVTGQDGAYLSEFLLDKGYEVHGLKRRSSSFNTERIDHLYQDPHIENKNFILHYGDLTDSTNLIRLVQQIQPNEYHRLAEQLGVDWDTAMHGFAADGRVGDSHMHVPGPDGKLGFGGACFPKDINALIELGNKNNLNMNVLKAAWKTNLEVRPEADWTQLKGRAVSK